MALLSANIIVCQSILRDVKTEIITAHNVLDTVTTDPGQSRVHFYTLTLVYGYADDTVGHTLSIRIAKPNGELVTIAQDHSFNYTRKINRLAPGGLHLFTEFVIDLAPLEPLETFYVVWAFLDSDAVAKTPLMLRRN